RLLHFTACERIICENPLRDRRALNDMLVNKTRHALRRHAVIPRALRVHEHRRTLTTNAQAADLRAVASIADVGILELLFERFPRLQTDFRRAALRAGAQKHVPLILADAVFRDHGLQLLVGIGHESFSRSTAPRTALHFSIRRWAASTNQPRRSRASCSVD